MKTQVLISGAGPTGLMMACQLRRYGIDTILIDKKEGITLRSKALAVQARSMEIYDQLGVIDTVMDQGFIAIAAKMISQGKKIGELLLGQFGKGLSPFPFLFILEQSKNERILSDYYNNVNGKTLWNTSLESYQDDGDKITATVIDKDGNKTNITADYLIGADGAHSLVRKTMGTPFHGGTYADLFLVADVIVDWEFEYNKLILLFEKNTFVALFPMSKEHRYRVVSIVPDEFAEQENLSFKDIEAFLHENLTPKIKFSDAKQFATYKVHHKYAEYFSQGRVFIAGDAAHIHSPAGGQGMNTGLQDAYNLAWKLALQIQKGGRTNLLDTYNEERQPNAVELVKTTDTGFRTIAGNSWFQNIVRRYLFPLMIRFVLNRDFTRRLGFRQVSQIGINYRKRKLSKGKSGLIVAGDRFPMMDLQINGKKTLVFDLFKNTKFHILTLEEMEVDPIQALLRDCDLEDWVSIHIIPRTIHNLATFNKKNKSSDRIFCLVRPDMHLAYVTDTFDAADFKKYLTSCFGATNI